MFETSIMNGKVVTSGTGPNTSVKKKLYIKIFAGEFSNRPPTPKKKKKLVGELLIRYSAREWPVKKNGVIIGDPGFLTGLGELFKNQNIKNYSDLDYASNQHDLRDIVTIRLGKKLTQEMVDRGWAQLVE